MRWLLAVAVLVAVIGSLGSASASPPSGPSAAVPTPTGLRPATIFEVKNLDSAALSATFIFSDSAGTAFFTMYDTVPIGQSRQYHVADISQIPSPFSGGVDIGATCVSVDPCFSAAVVGYDYQFLHVQLPIIKNSR